MNRSGKRFICVLTMLSLLLPLPVYAYANVRGAARDLRDARQEVREDKREIREDVRDLRQDVREGDKKEVRQDHREIREDRRDLRDDKGDRLDARQDLRWEMRESYLKRQNVILNQIKNRNAPFLQNNVRAKELAPIREKIKNNINEIDHHWDMQRLEKFARDRGLSRQETAEAVAEHIKDRISSSQSPEVKDLKTLARMHRFLQNHDKAREALKYALTLNPKDSDSIDEIGSLKEEVGDDSIDVFVTGQSPVFDVPPFVHDSGRTLVPIRALVEALGANVKYNPETQTATINRGDKVVEITLDQSEARVNGRAVPLDVPAFSKNGRTVVPLRFVSENLDLNVNWVPKGKIITVEDKTIDPTVPVTQSDTNTNTTTNTGGSGPGATTGQ